MMPVVIALLLSAPVFEMQPVPVQNPRAQAFFAPADGDAVPDLFVLDNQILTVYRTAAAPSLTIALPADTAAVDVFDLTGDGQVELLALHRDRLLRFALGEEAAGGVELFRVNSTVSEPRSQPVQFSMGLMWLGEPAIALPQADRIILLSLEGATITSFPVDAPTAVDTGARPLFVRGVEPNQVGSGNALELRVSMLQDINPRLPDALLPPRKAATVRPATLSHAREAARGDPSAWPWFPLEVAGDTAARVLYALEPPEFRDTLIRLPEERLPGAAALNETQPLRYPGALVSYTQDGLPDFNGDGYVDLLLWKAPLPGPSVDTLTRAAMAGTWPLTTTVHLYAPAKHKYEARPMAPIKHQVPVGWFVTTEQGSPLRNLVFKDFDGDGQTDLGCSADPFSFAVWIFDDGFSQRPDFRYTSKDPLGRLETAMAHAPGRLVAMVFRSERVLQILRVTH